VAPHAVSFVTFEDSRVPDRLRGGWGGQGGARGDAAGGGM